MSKKNEATKRQPGRPKADGTDRRQLILEVALREFGTHGYDGASLAQIAAGADITKAALLHYFRSKESLFAEVLAVRDIENVKDMVDLHDEHELSFQRLDQSDSKLAWAPDLKIWDMLKMLVGIAQVNETKPEQVKLFIAVSAQGTNRRGAGFAWLTQHMKHTVGLLIEAFEKAKEDGDVDPSLPSPVVARTIVAIMDGIQLQWTLGKHYKREPWIAGDLSTELANYIELIREKYGIEKK